MNRTNLVFVGLLCLGISLPVAANEFEPQLRDLAGGQLGEWTQHNTVISAIKAQNERHAGLGASDIDKMDKQWRAEVKGNGEQMIAKVLANELSAFLKQVKSDSQGLYTEIFVMDNKGLNVGQSDVTSDYWQGDEAKWQETFAKGPDALHISEVEEDESTQTFQSQVSVPISDPSTGAVIGAVTVGVNVELLQ